MSDLATPGADAFLDGTALPSTLWLQLHTGNPGTSGTANVATESDRKSFTRTSALNGVCTNDSVIQWLDVLTDGGSDDITHISIWGSATLGVCWFVDDIADTAIFDGDSVTVVIGTLSITLPVWA